MQVLEYSVTGHLARAGFVSKVLLELNCLLRVCHDTDVELTPTRAGMVLIQKLPMAKSPGGSAFTGVPIVVGGQSTSK